MIVKFVVELGLETGIPGIVGEHVFFHKIIDLPFLPADGTRISLLDKNGEAVDGATVTDAEIEMAADGTCQGLVSLSPIPVPDRNESWMTAKRLLMRAGFREMRSCSPPNYPAASPSSTAARGGGAVYAGGCAMTRHRKSTRQHAEKYFSADRPMWTEEMVAEWAARERAEKDRIVLSRIEALSNQPEETEGLGL